MKVLHVTFSFAPDPMGGTEIYVEDLCRQLSARRVATVVAAPASQTASYEALGLRVHRFACAQQPGDLDALYGAGDPIAAQAFDAVLDAEQPDLIHQHALTPACSGELIRRAKRRGLPVVFTYHTPAVSCQRGTLLRWGSETCDGRLDVRPCTACTLHGLGLGRAISRMIAATPEAIGQALGNGGLAGGGWTAFRMSTLMRLRHDEVREVLASVDRVVALTEWVRDLLRLNGVPEHRIASSPHGVRHVPIPDRAAWDAQKLRLAHLGRIDAGKGTRLLISALRSMPDAAITLDIFGIQQSHADLLELERLRALTEGDSRIRFLPPIDHDGVIECLAAFDAVVVPSQLMETGPLVVLEAFAAGVPVIGSALGGIAARVAHDRTGLLVHPHDSIRAWRDTLQRCLDDRELLTTLRRQIVPPRSIEQAALEMCQVYDSVLEQGQGAVGEPVLAGSRAVARSGSASDWRV